MAKNINPVAKALEAAEKLEGLGDFKAAARIYMDLLRYLEAPPIQADIGARRPPHVHRAEGELAKEIARIRSGVIEGEALPAAPGDVLADLL
jgi:hypothetical protein